MARMTGGKRAVREGAMVARNPERASGGLQKRCGPRRAAAQMPVEAQVDYRCDEAVCLARQAGPGPRI